MKKGLCVVLLLLSIGATAQTALTPGQVAVEFWNTLNGEAGPRNWDALSTLCLPNARVNGIRYDGEEAIVKPGSLEDYRRNTSGFFSNNNFAQEVLEEQIFVYDRLASVLHKYRTSIQFADGSFKEIYGIASFQLIREKDAWLISTVSWNDSKGSLEQLPKIVPDPTGGATPKPDEVQIIEAPLAARFESGVTGIIYTEAEVDSAASYKGGETAIFKWLGENMELPSDPAEAKMSGQMDVTFIVDSEGFITNVSSPNAPATGWFFQVSRTLIAMPQWIPAKKDGKTVNSRVKLQITFKGTE